MSDEPFPTDDGSSTVDFTTSAPSLDTIWLDLDGDLQADVAITITDVSGPFAVDPSYDDPFLFPAGDDGAPTSLLMPWDAGAGYADPWSLPADGADWTSFQSFDPMSAGSDWTVDGGWSVPGMAAADGGSFDSAWLSDPGSYYDSSSYWDSSGYWDTSGYYDATADSFSVPADPADTGIYDASAYDSGYESSGPAATGYDTTGYDTTGYDAAGDMTTDSWTDTWTTTDTEWVTPAWDIDGASSESTMWMDSYNELSHGTGGEWDLWNASVEAYLNGDSDLSYQLQQESIAAGAAANEAWTYSNEAWSDPAYFPDPYEVTTQTTYEATYDTTSYDTTSYDTTSYDTTSYDTTSEW